MKKNNKGVIVLIAILILGLLGTSGYIVYDKVFRENDARECEENIGTEQEDTNYLKSDDYISSFGKKLLDKTVSTNFESTTEYELIPVLLSEDKITYETMPETNRVKQALSLISPSLREKYDETDKEKVKERTTTDNGNGYDDSEIQLIADNSFKVKKL